MKILRNFISRYFWYLYPTETLFEGQGIYSKVTVIKKANWLKLYTGSKYIQTVYNPNMNPWGNHYDWYLAMPWFSGDFTGKINKVLILGLGGGAQIKLLNKFYEVDSITTVEIDPLIIDISKKYFDVNDKNLTIINDDARKFVESDKDTYDLIIADLFKEDKFDTNCQDKEFLTNTSKLLSPNGVLVINRLLNTPFNENVTSIVKGLFFSVISLKKHQTQYIICTNSPKAPQNLHDIKQLFNEAIKKYPKLSFINDLNNMNVKVI